jgi:phosphoribosylamine--glycine ligase
MERIGILVISYGARGAAMIDAFSRSQNYQTDIYVVDRQRNPFNVKLAIEHTTIPDLNVNLISRFASRRRDKIDLGIVGPEKPIIDGVRDVLEKETGIPIICPTKRYAIEASKVAQRRLLQKAAPDMNPRFTVFSPEKYKNINAVKKDLYNWLDELQNRAVIKPDRPASGKGVGVWGDHFDSRRELLDHFLADFQHGKVIVEEKMEGEESSFQAFCDGKTLCPLPETRDYKRAFDGDKGPNTGGMGSYKNTGDLLPFMHSHDHAKEVEIIDRIFNHLKKSGSRSELRGIPFYTAFIHTADGPKILENNSRPGDPEIMNILPLLKDDFVDVCYKMAEGNLTKIEVERRSSVVIYKAPPSYAGYANSFQSRIVTEEIGKPVKLPAAKKLGSNLRVYPASMELRDGQTYALSSRAVAVVGLAETIEAARQLSLEGIQAIIGGALWNRNDIASPEHIQKSTEHMRDLRRTAT